MRQTLTYSIKMAEQNGSQLLASYLEFKGRKGQVPPMQSHGRHAEGGTTLTEATHCRSTQPFPAFTLRVLAPDESIHILLVTQK